MRLYHIQILNKIRHDHLSHREGTSFTLTPGIPESTLPDEDATSPRICCAPTIYQCMLGIQVGGLLTTRGVDNVPAAIYVTEIEESKVTWPGNLVPDAEFTGECWVCEPHNFVLQSVGRIRRMVRLGRTAYSWFSFTANDEDEVIDRIAGPVFYGELDESFAWLDEDPKYVDDAYHVFDTGHG